MIDLTRVDVDLYDTIAPVIVDLVAETGADPSQIMLVGAACRDILHAAFGHAFEARATTDIDLGIAVSDWGISNRIDERYRQIGSNGIRYRIAETPVDIMPFGDVEDPEGITYPAARGQNLVVFGFRDVYDRSLPLMLPTGHEIRIPQPAGYVALKIRSWIDRSVHHYGHDKDAKDLALAAFWYQNAAEISERLYDTDDGFAVLAESGMDVEAASTRLLGEDALSQLSTANRGDLARRWAERDMESLARDFLLPTGGPRSPTLERRRALVAQLGGD